MSTLVQVRYSSHIKPGIAQGRARLLARICCYRLVGWTRRAPSWIDTSPAVRFLAARRQWHIRHKLIQYSSQVLCEDLIVQHPSSVSGTAPTFRRRHVVPSNCQLGIGFSKFIISRSYEHSGYHTNKKSQKNQLFRTVLSIEASMNEIKSPGTLDPPRCYLKADQWLYSFMVSCWCAAFAKPFLL